MVQSNRHVCSSLEGFIQQLSVNYITHGYWFYVTGWVRDGKDPTAIDRKLIERYDAGLSKWQKARRRELGQASVQYLRYGRFFILLATERGTCKFKTDEARSLRDARKVPVKFGGYAVSFKRGHACVRIELDTYRMVKAHLVGLATHRRKEALEAALFKLPFEPYAPVRQQLLQIFRAVNRARNAAGYEPLSVSCVRFQRRIFRPFDGEETEPGKEAA
jgi:hypothetical protein